MIVFRIERTVHYLSYSGDLDSCVPQRIHRTMNYHNLIQVAINSNYVVVLSDDQFHDFRKLHVLDLYGKIIADAVCPTKNPSCFDVTDDYIVIGGDGEIVIMDFSL